MGGWRFQLHQKNKDTLPAMVNEDVQWRVVQYKIRGFTYIKTSRTELACLFQVGVTQTKFSFDPICGADTSAKSTRQTGVIYLTSN